jgi:hypothetical protein
MLFAKYHGLPVLLSFSKYVKIFQTVVFTASVTLVARLRSCFSGIMSSDARINAEAF